MENEKKKKGSTLDREEYGYGYDRSPDDLDVIGRNDTAKKKNRLTKDDHQKSAE